MLRGTPSLSDATMTLLERVLDLRTQRHTLLAGNIANAETPRYQAIDIAFEGLLKEALSLHDRPTMVRTNPRHLPVQADVQRASVPDLVYRPSSGIGNDLNTVDLDAEMARLAHNSLLYHATAQMLSRKFAGLRLAIDGGK
jgi:flagellar basal-body rod protein FlgB